MAVTFLTLFWNLHEHILNHMICSVKNVLYGGGH